MINPRAGDVWMIDGAVGTPVEAVVTGVRRLTRHGFASGERVWQVHRKDRATDSTLYLRGFFLECLKRAPKRKKLSPAAMTVLGDLVRRGDLSFHTTHQVARSLVKHGLAKWVTTTEPNFASLHATVEGFRLVDGGGDD